jgi:hypothetical protein
MTTVLEKKVCLATHARPGALYGAGQQTPACVAAAEHNPQDHGYQPNPG